MDLAVIVNGDDPDDGLAVPIAGKEHCAGTEARRVLGAVDQPRPSSSWAMRPALGSIETSLNAMGPPRQRPSQMTLRPA
ncbi:MAG: hypothetical protein NVSMB4_02710 [Acidimicrobiales bacterium]